MPVRPLVTRYEQELRLFPDFWHKVGVLALVVFAVAFPFLAGDRWLGLGSDALIAIVGSCALMILTGFAGQVSLGHAAFLAIGAYTVAVLGNELQLPFWLAVPAAGALAAAVGLAIGPLALRLHGLYLAIVTLGLLFLVQHVLMSMPDLTGGAVGRSVPMFAGFGGDLEAAPFGDFWDETVLGPVTLAFEQKLYFVLLLLALLTVLATKNIQRSSSGRAMMAVRDHDLAAAALGVNPSTTKVIAFGVSSFFAGVAGAMYAFKAQYISVSPPFDLFMSIEYIAMIVLGGIGTVFGAVWGAIAFILLEPIAHSVGAALPFVSDLSSHQQSSLIFALFVIGFLIFEPFGLVGIWLRIKRYFLAWPFRY